MYNCKNGHNIKNIKINEFENTQKIDISKIICDEHKEINKGNTHNNEFHRCITCNKNLCPLCKSTHNNNHKIIEYDNINYICNLHTETFTRYCFDCKKNLCMACEIEHRGHKGINLGEMLLNENNNLKEFKEYIDKLNKEIIDIIKKLENIMTNMEIYYKINYNIINNNKKRNYETLKNINEFIYYNNNIIKDIKEILNDKDKNNKINNIINIYNKINNKNYIIGEIDIKESDINKEIRIINTFEEIKKLTGINLKDEYNYENEKEIKEKCIIKINNKIIPFCYKYKFNKMGNYIIEYSFIDKLNKANHLFDGCSNLTYLNLSNFNSKNVTNMYKMFCGCHSLLNLDLSNLKTENVINMDYMFYECKSLKNLNLSSFNTQNVETMEFMFDNCKSLSYLNLSNFNTQKVTGLHSMFSDCDSLSYLNLSSFNTEKVIGMGYMFYCCESLSYLNLSNFRTQNVKYMHNMFFGCKCLSYLNLSNFNTQNVTQINDIFYRTYSLNKNNVITKDKEILKMVEIKI